MGKQTDLILLDFSKALDKVAHEKLNLKLNHYSIREDTLKSIKDFLDNWKQTTVISGEKSETIPVSSGVPQGLVLRPSLLLAFNNLPEQVDSRDKLFADDTAMYLTICSSQSDSLMLQQDLLNLEKWEKVCDMTFNLSKCQYLHITCLKLNTSCMIFSLNVIWQPNISGAPFQMT